MKTTTTIQNEILSTRGSKIKIFGQNTIISNEANPYLVDTVDLLESFKQYESEYYNRLSDNEIEELFEEGLLTDNKSDNSYNWSANLTNDINFNSYKTHNDTFMYEIKAHLYGDIRVNYTDTICYEFDTEEEFFEVLMDTCVFTTVTINGMDYQISTDAISEGYRIYCEEMDYLDFEVYGYFDTEEELILAITEAQEELI